MTGYLERREDDEGWRTVIGLARPSAEVLALQRFRLPRWAGAGSDPGGLAIAPRKSTGSRLFEQGALIVVGTAFVLPASCRDYAESLGANGGGGGEVSGAGSGGADQGGARGGRGGEAGETHSAGGGGEGGGRGNGGGTDAGDAGAGATSAGGTDAGGADHGGSETGGAASGGEASGGEASGGEASGGEASGGEASGGAASGGAASGGAASGGAGTVSKGGASGRGGQTGVDSAGNGGAAGGGGEGSTDPTWPPREPTEPFCVSYRMGDTRIDTKPVRDLAVSMTAVPWPYQVSATIPAVNIVALAWKDGSQLEDPWTQWTCHDQVVAPDRTAATNDASGEVDMFATSLTGRLYYRHQYRGKLDWLAWGELVPPRPGTAIEDIAAAGGPNLDGSHVFVVATGGRVFDRTKRRIDDVLMFDEWRTIGGVSAHRLAATGQSDGRHTLLVLAKDGSVRMAQSEAGKAIDAAPVWTPLPVLPGVIGVDLAKDSSGQMLALAIDEQGALWSCRGLPTCSWEVRPGTGPKLVEIAAGSYLGQPATFFGLDAAGVAYITFDRVGDAWHPLVN